MKSQRPFEEDDDSAWRAMLPRWTAPAAPGRLERALRDEFRRRHRADVFRLWAGRAALLTLAASVALIVRPGRRGVHDVEDRGLAVATLDLSGFEPLAPLRLGRAVPAATTIDLEGFEPVRRLTLERRRP